MKELELCCWVGADERIESPVITRRFHVQQAISAELTITGLGYFEAWLNQQPVTDARLLPVVSDYEPRDLAAFLYPHVRSPVTSKR